MQEKQSHNDSLVTKRNRETKTSVCFSRFVSVGCRFVVVVVVVAVVVVVLVCYVYFLTPLRVCWGLEIEFTMKKGRFGGFVYCTFLIHN